LDTQASVTGISHYVIFVPHRDSLKPLEDYRRKLFAAGWHGAHSFPAAAPLALLSRPLRRAELQELSAAIRAHAASADASGKIRTAGTALARHRAPATFSPRAFFGLSLNLALNESFFPQTAREKILSLCVPPVLCAAVLAEGETPPPLPPPQQAPELSFRAAYTANLALRPLSSGDGRYSFQWKIGEAVWLANSGK